jgi:hypothetical protein
MIVYVVADNPIGDSAHYPDSAKHNVPLPERAIVRVSSVEYFDGEE